MATTLVPRMLTQARAPLTLAVRAVNEKGQAEPVSIPAERALTLYVDGREVVTLMTLGAEPELLVLGYLRNQALVASAQDVESISVDWEVQAAAVKTRGGMADVSQSKRIVTTGCGQGSMLSHLLDELEQIKLPPTRLAQSQINAVLETIRLKETTYKSAGSVHACALFRGSELLCFVEDVGRHNALDTIAGWMWMQDSAVQNGADKLLYTTGRLTSEMIIKAAQMGVPVVVSRSGITQMGYELANKLDLCAIGRAINKRFVGYSAMHRLEFELS